MSNPNQNTASDDRIMLNSAQEIPNPDYEDDYKDEMKNLCLKCGVDMGACNPRQLCGKIYCLDDICSSDIKSTGSKRNFKSDSVKPLSDPKIPKKIKMIYSTSHIQKNQSGVGSSKTKSI